MDFTLDQKHEMARDLFKQFAETEVKPLAQETDETEVFPAETVAKMGKYGFMGIPVPKEYGGQGCDPLTYVMCVEELSKVCGTTGVIVSAHTSLCIDPIMTFGTEEQKKKYVPDLASGKKIGAFGLTEPGAGTDAQGCQTKAVLDGDEWVLNGSKCFITNGKVADVYIIIAITSITEDKRGRKKKNFSAFIVDKGTPGFSFGTKEKKMGIRGSSTYELIFEDARIPKDALLGKEGRGFPIAMHTLDGGRIGIAAQALGIAEGALERTIEYTKERKQFGRSIAQQQNTQFKLADMATRIDAAKYLVYAAAMKKAEFAKNPKVSYSVDAAKAKLFAAETAMAVTTECVQLFGDRMYIANATGCSSIWGNSSPSTPYTVNEKGHGPAWSNSLFEDAAEFGYGMLLGHKAIRAKLQSKVEALVADGKNADVKAAGQEWLDTFNSGVTNGAATDKLVAALEACGCDASKDILAEKDFLAKKSQWIFGGDGWAYDIGFGGVDHVLASGQDVNIMVFDTEVYSNTGGQSSKATPTGAIAQFAAGGKEVKKKDLASIAMSYGYVYVAQIAMGADYNQCVKAIAEAEAYPGPSLVIAYAPCINHGIKVGMSKAQTEEKLAVEAGYWHTFRYNPALKAEGKAAFSLDSKAPTGDYKAFLNGEVRYNALARFNPERAEELFAKSEETAKERYEYLNKLITLYGGEN